VFAKAPIPMLAQLETRLPVGQEWRSCPLDTHIGIDDRAAQQPRVGASVSPAARQPVGVDKMVGVGTKSRHQHLHFGAHTRFEGLLSNAWCTPVQRGAYSWRTVRHAMSFGTVPELKAESTECFAAQAPFRASFMLTTR
jgi:hypothetical protein